MIDLLGVEVHYGRTVIGPVDHSVTTGAWTCLIGPNGAGKSSILKAISALVPSSGSITIDGRSIRDLGARDLARLIAHVPQQPVLPDDMTVAEYALLGRTPYIATFGVESRHDRALVADILGELDLSRFADRTLGQLSGGERQRVVLARALTQQAPILLLDEPTSALDVGHAQHVLELIDQLRRSRSLTVVAAMHDLTLAAQYADELLLLRDGKSTVSGTPAEVLTETSLRRYYGANVRVMHDECGGVIVVPIRPLHP